MLLVCVKLLSQFVLNCAVQFSILFSKLLGSLEIGISMTISEMNPRKNSFSINMDSRNRYVDGDFTWYFLHQASGEKCHGISPNAIIKNVF